MSQNVSSGQRESLLHFDTPVHPVVYGSPMPESDEHSHLYEPSRFIQIADGPHGPFGSIGMSEVHSFISSQPVFAFPVQPALHWQTAPSGVSAHSAFCPHCFQSQGSADTRIQ